MDSFELQVFGYNLTDLMQQGMFSPLVGYEGCLARIFQILLQQGESRKKCNPLLLDVDETRQWRIVIEVVRRMSSGEAPEGLLTRQVVALNYEALFTNFSTSFKSHSLTTPRQSLPSEGEQEAVLEVSKSEERLEQLFMSYFSERWWPSLEDWNAPNEILSRLKAIFLAVRQSEGKILLFANHFHWLLGGQQQNPVDAIELLKPVLARREIQLIGACTPAQYQQYIERDAAIARRLQEISVRSDEELQHS